MNKPLAAPLDCPRPTPLTVNPDGIPLELRECSQWVVWRYWWNGKKWTKPPYSAFTREKCAITDPLNFATFDEAYGAYQEGNFEGIGFVLTTTDPFTGIDLDHCLFGDPEFPGITTKAQAEIQMLDSYAEKSPSGEGLRGIVKGELPAAIKREHIEVYDRGRYLTITGQVYGKLKPIQHRQKVLDRLHEIYGRTQPKKARAQQDHSSLADGDKNIINRLSRHDKFSPLWKGDHSAYPSQSEADLAICGIVAGVTRDSKQIDRIFRASGLYRDKWDKRHGATTYGSMTIEKALTPGELGERGEKQKIPSNVQGRMRGERGRKLGENEISALMDAAREILKPSESEIQYPIDALGVLADPCRAVVAEGQVSPEMAGQCLLGTAALLVQSVADVRTLAGVKPCSLSLITIAESGEGKSTAEEAALRPVNAKQRIEGSEYREQVGNKKSDNVIQEPFRIMRDGTAEGIRRSFREGRPSQGCFTSEAAVMLSGYGMSAEHRGKTAANLNSLWDSGEISVARGTDTRLQLYDRRLSIHWLIQPDIAYQAVHDPMLSSVGFWPRFLLAYPAPTPPLKAKIFRPGQHKAIVEFWGRCKHFLELPMGESCSDLQVIESSDAAQETACRYYELMQVEGKRGALTEVKPFALRATEQAFRIAGVLAAFSEAMEIDEQAMKNGITLASYSIDSWLSIFSHDEENAGIKWALLLYEWILKQEGQKATTTAMLRIATPKGLRSRDRRDTAIALLTQASLVFQERDTVYAICEGVEL